MQSFANSTKLIASISCALIMFFSIYSCAQDAGSAVNANSSTSAAPVAPVDVQSGTSAIPAPTTTVTAPVNTPRTTAPKVNSSSQLANLIGGLALILVLIYGLSWFVKRFTQGGFMHNPNMKIISTMPLGTRERLVLIDVAGKQLLLGVTANQINSLHVFDEPLVQPEQSPPAASEFSQKLMAILQQKNFTSPDDGSHKKSNL